MTYRRKVVGGSISIYRSRNEGTEAAPPIRHRLSTCCDRKIFYYGTRYLYLSSHCAVHVHWAGMWPRTAGQYILSSASGHNVPPRIPSDSSMQLHPTLFIDYGIDCPQPPSPGQSTCLLCASCFRQDFRITMYDLSPVHVLTVAIALLF